jgi:hypothetical protein
MLSNPYVHTSLAFLIAWVLPFGVHLLLNPKKGSKLDLLLGRLVDLGFNPAAFESDADRILKQIAAEKLK